MTQSRDVSSAAGFAGASMDPRPPSSSSSSSSAMASSSGRPLLGYRLTPSSASLCCSYHLLDVDVVDKSAADSEYRRQKVPHFEGERAVLSASFQAQPGQHSQSTQTVPRQQRAAITQYERQQFSHAAREVALSSDALRAFLDSAWPDVQRELSKNLTLDLFKDQMRVQDDEDDDTQQQQQQQQTAAQPQSQPGRAGGSGSGARPSHALSVFHSFHHLLYSRSHAVGWVEWHPARCCVAFSLVPQWSFDEWCDHSGEVSLSYILLYDLNNLLQPYTVIKVPGVVTVFRFHPTQHLLLPTSASSSSSSSPSSSDPSSAQALAASTSSTPLIAGLQTGQVILYHIPNAPTAQQSKAVQQQQQQQRSAQQRAQQQPLPQPHTAAENAPAFSSHTSASVASPAPSSSSSSPSASSSSFLSSLSSSPSDGSCLVASPLYSLLSNLDRSHGRPVTDLHWLPAALSVNKKGERLSSAQQGASSSSPLCSQVLSFAADGKVLWWDFRHLNEPVQPGHYGSSHANADDALSGDDLHEKRDGKWSPMYSLPMHLAQPGSAADGGEAGVSHSAGGGAGVGGPNSAVQVSTAFPVSSALTARRVAPGPSPASAVLLAVSEDGEVLEIDTAARPSAESHGSGGAVGSVLRRCRVHSSVGVSIDRSCALPSLYVSCGESTWAVWQAGDDQPVFVSPPCAASVHYSAARWSPTRPAVLCLGRSDGVIEIWDCLDQTHTAAYTFPTGSADAVIALQFQPPPASHAAAAGSSHAQTQPAAAGPQRTNASPDASVPLVAPAAAASSSSTAPSPYPSSGRQYLAAGDGGGKCHIIEVPRPLRRKLQAEDAAMSRWVERERQRGAHAQRRLQLKSRGQSTLTPYQQQQQQQSRSPHAASPPAAQQQQLPGDALQTQAHTTDAQSEAAASSASDVLAESEYGATTGTILAALTAQLRAIDADAGQEQR